MITHNMGYMMDADGIRGYREGLNPMFGEWTQRFAMSPILRDSSNQARNNFRRDLQTQLSTRCLFSGELKLSITLCLDEQSILEGLFTTRI